MFKEEKEKKKKSHVGNGITKGTTKERAGMLHKKKYIE